MYHIISFEELMPEDRPQDPTLDGSMLDFQTLEHGGEFPDTMPQAIRITDGNGKSCLYVPFMISGKVAKLNHSAICRDFDRLKEYTKTEENS
jgi:hypothetical protein